MSHDDYLFLIMDQIPGFSQSAPMMLVKVSLPLPPSVFRMPCAW